MATEKLYGLREIRIKNGATNVALPVARRLGFKPNISSAKLEGDDSTAAVVTTTDTYTLTVEAGGLSLDAAKELLGGTLDTSVAGTRKLTSKSTDVFPYVELYGRSINDAAGDVWLHFFKVKVTDFSGTLTNKEFFITSLTMEALPGDSGSEFYEFVAHDTAAALPTT